MQLSAQTSQILAIWLGVAFQVISVPIHDVPDPMAFMELLKRMLSDEASTHNAFLGPEVFSYRLRMSLRGHTASAAFAAISTLVAAAAAVSVVIPVAFVPGSGPFTSLGPGPQQLRCCKRFCARIPQSRVWFSTRLIDTLVANSLSQVTFS
ncbi:hypothetical protein MJT46_008404 [Ovis ammon polii x Ovis aries]|nr:hypothetical protein MJT46_008404 [Ovis ammon polii x Ovis aries]